MIPGYNTSDENLHDMMGFLAGLEIKNIEIHPYRKIQEKKHKDVGLEPVVIEEVTPELKGKIQRLFWDSGFVVAKRKPYREKEKCKSKNCLFIAFN